MMNLQKLFLDNNQLTGEIPKEIGTAVRSTSVQLMYLRWLYLDNNQLT